MRARAFAIFVAMLFVTGSLAGTLTIRSGYGLPSRFHAIYNLEALEILAGVGKELGKPVVYEWPVTTLLRPGETYINITLLRFKAECGKNSSPVVITVFIGDKQFTSNGTSLSAHIKRDSMFLIAKVRVLIDSNCTIPPGTPSVYVEFTSQK